MDLIKKIVAVAFACVLLSACNSSDTSKSSDGENGDKGNSEIAANPAIAEKDIVATVNGKKIDIAALKAYTSQRNGSRQNGQPEISSAEALNEYVNYELIVQDATAKGVDKLPGVKEEINLLKRSALVNAAFRAYITANPLTDEDMKKDYDSRISDLTLSEYKIRHILVDKEETAKQALTALDKGGDFITVAKKLSTGPSAKNGGDLGWLAEPDMLPEFRGPVKSLEKGKYAPAAVQTRFGWHVVYLEDRRDTPPPPFSEVKERVRNVLQRRQIETYIRGLRDKATIDIAESAQPRSPHPVGPAGKTTPGSAPLESLKN